LIYQIGTHETRILIDIPDYVYKAASTTGGVKNHICKNVIPTLPKSVQPMVEIALKEGRLRSMPNSWLPSELNKTTGILFLGDAMNIRHPLIGGGMTVGLNDVALVSQLLSPQVVASLNDVNMVLKQIKIFHSQRKAYSMSLNVLAQALYSLFVADGMIIYFSSYQAPSDKIQQIHSYKFFNVVLSITSGLEVRASKKPQVLWVGLSTVLGY
jgi:squalene monooxygenase